MKLLGGYVNPLLKLPSAQRIIDYPGPMIPKQLLADLLMDLRGEADDQAENAWRRRKGPIAGYWRGACTYTLHTARVIKRSIARRG